MIKYNNDQGDEYRTVTVVVEQLRVDSIMVSGKFDGWKPIARSLIHGGDNLKLLREQHSLPKEITLRIMEWKADELHLS